MLDSRAVAPLLPNLYWELKTMWRLEEYRLHYEHLTNTTGNPEEVCAAATAINLLSLNLRTLRGSRRRPAHRLEFDRFGAQPVSCPGQSRWAAALCPSCMRCQSAPTQVCSLCTSLHQGHLTVYRPVQLV